MIKTYATEYKAYVDNENIGTHYTNTFLCEETEVENDQTIFINWDNLDEHIEILNIAADRKDIEQRKKGRVAYLAHWAWWEATVKKEWKHELNVRVEITTEELAVSLDDIMKYRDIDMAIKYLKERGLSVCPIAR